MDTWGVVLREDMPRLFGEKVDQLNVTATINLTYTGGNRDVICRPLLKKSTGASSGSVLAKTKQRNLKMKWPHGLYLIQGTGQTQTLLFPFLSCIPAAKVLQLS